MSEYGLHRRFAVKRVGLKWGVVFNHPNASEAGYDYGFEGAFVYFWRKSTAERIAQACQMHWNDAEYLMLTPDHGAVEPALET